MASAAMWTSKLGNKFPMASMQQGDQTAQRELKRLRTLRANSFCFDCGCQDNSWSSVNHGVFICVVCSDVHRSVGTHITKVKGCTGTYLWGPDELEQMKTIGNQRGEERYGKVKVSPGASKEQKQQHVIDKYDKRLFVDKREPTSQRTNSIVHKIEQTRQQPVPSEGCRLGAKMQSSEVEKTASSKLKAKVSSQPLMDELFAEAHETRLVEEVVVTHTQHQPALSVACRLGAKKQGNELEKMASSKVKAQEISQSLFDDLFAEAHETRPIEEVVVTKQDDIASRRDSNQSNNLDDFLDSMLCAKIETMTNKNSSSPASVAPNQGTAAAVWEDPFFDWAL